MTDLSPGWEWTMLGEIADTTLGKMLDRGKSGGHPHVPYLRNVNVQWGHIDLTDINTMELAPGRHEEFALCEGDLLVCEGGEVGRCAIYQGGPAYMAFQKALHRVRPMAGVDTRYLRYLLEYYTNGETLLPFVTGSTIKHLPQVQLRRLPVPLPPAAEQQRVVAALGENLALLDSGETSLGAAQARVKRLENLVAEDALRRVGTAPCSPMGEILREPLRNGFSGRATKAEDGIRTLTLSAVTQNEFSDRYTKIADVVGRNTESLWLADGDVFIQRSNTPDLVGTSAVYRGGDRWAIYPDLLIRVRPMPAIIPEFLHAVLSSARVRHELKDSAKGLAGSMPKIDQGTVSRIQIPIVTVVEQTRVINDVAFARSYASRLLGAIDVAAARSTQLRRSLLAEAVTGRLVPQDPEDEPASVLLDRIRAERDKAGPRRCRRASASP